MGATQSTSSSHVLETPHGSLNGLRLKDPSGKPIYDRYTRIPYAKPPVGTWRWRRPQPLAANFTFNGPDGHPGDYTKFGPICPQPVYKSARLDNPETVEPEHEQDEDCLYLNIWVPCGTPPPSGWPVQFFIHGGWLQIGDAMQDNSHDPFDLLAHTESPRILVSPTYRLNVLGFLTGNAVAEGHEDPAPGNYGFWDQRVALEWTAANIKHFGGNPANITVGGLSAGANSTFFQLYYDTYLPAEKRLIKRIFLWSNAVGNQPNTFATPSINEQFNELCAKFSVPESTSAADKLARLRAISAPKLVEAIVTMKQHTFRASTDSSFISPSFLATIHNGSLTTLLAKHNIQVMLGEVQDEKLLYRLVNPPSDYRSLQQQLLNYYPQPVVSALLHHYPVPREDDPNADQWADTYAQIVADCQVHATIRGLTHSFLSPPTSPHVIALPISSVHRYRIRWRAKALDAWILREVGVCHAADGPIWWCSGWRARYTDEDKRKTLEFLRPFGKFLEGDGIDWGTTNEREIREMNANGEIEIVEDDNWSHGLDVWECLRSAQLGV